MIAYLPLIVAIVGLLVYALTPDPHTRTIEVGRILFWTGTLAFLFSGTAAHLFQKIH